MGGTDGDTIRAPGGGLDDVPEQLGTLGEDDQLGCLYLITEKASTDMSDVPLKPESVGRPLRWGKKASSRRTRLRKPNATYRAVVLGARRF